MNDSEVGSFQASVSIIIPCFNNGKYLSDCIHSALMQSGTSIEIIVINDGSTDSTVEVLQQFRTAVRIIHQANVGASAARNRGLQEAKSKWIKFLDADDYLLPGAIAGQLAETALIAENMFPVGRSLRLSEKSGCLVPHASHDFADVREADLGALLFDIPLISAPLFPRAALIDVGGFDERLSFREDGDVFVRVVLAGWEPFLGNTPVFVYRDHTTPGRVSRQVGVDVSISQHQMFRRWKAIVDSGCSGAGPKVSRGLAQAAWVTGRNVLRSGEVNVSKSLFELARSFDSGVDPVGTPSYRFLTKLVGEQRAEGIVVRLKGAWSSLG